MDDDNDKSDVELWADDTGAGKSRALARVGVQNLESIRPGSARAKVETLYISLTTEQSEELHDEIHRQMVVQGIDPDPKKLRLFRGMGQLCQRPDEMAEWTGAGLEALTYCRQFCDVRDRCEYYAQKRGQCTCMSGSPTNAFPPKLVRNNPSIKKRAGETDEDFAFRHYQHQFTPPPPYFEIVLLDEISISGLMEAATVPISIIDTLLRQPPVGAKTQLTVRGATGDRKRDVDIARHRLQQIKILMEAAATGKGGGRLLTVEELCFSGRDTDTARLEWAGLKTELRGWRIRFSEDEVNSLKASFAKQGIKKALAGTGDWNFAVKSMIAICDAAIECLLDFRDHEKSDTGIPAFQLRAYDTRDGIKISTLKRGRIFHRLLDANKIIIADASTPRELLTKWFGPITRRTSKPIMWEHAELVQVIDQVGSRRKFAPGAHSDAAAVDRNITSLVNILMARCAELGEKEVGFISLKATVAEVIRRMNELGGKPDNLVTAHYGALRGLNKMEQVAELYIVGRMCPPVSEIERLAAVATGEQIDVLDDDARGLPRRSEEIVFKDKDGKSYAVTAHHEYHPDKHVEMVRRVLVNEEIRQAIARARPQRRTADNPVKIIVMTNTPTIYPPQSVTTMREALSTGVALDGLFARVGLPDPSDKTAVARLIGEPPRARSLRKADNLERHADRWNTLGKTGHTYLVCVQTHAPTEGPRQAGNERSHTFDPFLYRDILKEVGSNACLLSSSGPREAAQSRHFFLFRSHLPTAEAVGRAMEREGLSGLSFLKLPPSTPPVLSHPHVQAIATGCAIEPGQPGRRQFLARLTGKSESAVRGALNRHGSSVDRDCFDAALRAGWVEATLKLEDRRVTTILVRDKAVLASLAFMGAKLVIRPDSKTEGVVS